MPKYCIAALICLPLTAAVPDLHSCATAIDRGDFTPAAREAQAYSRLHPASVEARILLARAYMGLNNGAGALEQLREVLRREPDNVEALYYVSKLSGILSQMEFAEVARIGPDSARMHQIRAQLFEAQGDAAGAEKEYLTALDKRPGTVTILVALGELKRLYRKYDEALAWYGKALQSEPDNYDALYGTGVCYRYSRSPADAVPLFRRALSVDPSSPAAKVALGESLLMTGNARDAVPLLEAAAKSDPNVRRVQALLARAYREVGRNDDARRAFDRFRELTKPGESDSLATEDQ
jgi:Tfp pilus assembly protein PilF